MIAGDLEAGVQGQGLTRILIVDDDLIFGKNFAVILKDKGYSVDLVESGNEAVNRLSAEDFNIVFLDIKLPDINGIEVLKKIKEINRKTNVIIMSAFSFDGLDTDMAREGTVKYFCKPFNINEALGIIKEITG